MSNVITERIKQLEHQNLKFKKLLEATLQITSEQTAKNLQIKSETEFLKLAVSQLEDQKQELEEELRSLQEQNHAAQDCSKLHIHFDDHVDIQSKLVTNLQELQLECKELEDLKTEDEQLNQIISKLEKERRKLQEDILKVKKANEENNQLAYENLKLRQELAILEQESMNKNLDDDQISGEDLVNQLINVESLKSKLEKELQAAETSTMDPLNLSTENTVLELKISWLEKQKQKFLKQLKAKLLRATNEIYELHSDTSDGQLRRLLNELDIHKAVLMVNLSNIKEMRSCEKMETDIDGQIMNERTTDPTSIQPHNCFVCSNSRIFESIADNPGNGTGNIEEINNYIIENYENNNNNKSEEAFSDVEDASKSEPPSVVSNPASKLDSGRASNSSLRSNSSEMIQDVIDVKEDNKPGVYDTEVVSEDISFEQENRELPTVSEEDETQNDLLVEHIQLKETINRLEKERLFLLEQLQSISMAAAQSWEATRPDTYAGDESDCLRRLPLDDATNQMYVNEEQRLEQRIRELETDNHRIRRDLNSLIEEVQSDTEDCILQTGERLIRENKNIASSDDEEELN